MTITNGYCTLDEFKAQPNITVANPTDDSFIEGIIERISRWIDNETGRWYYSDTQTRYFDIPSGRQLDLDAPLLTLTTLTNGDGTVITSADYRLIDSNVTPYYAVRLKVNSSYVWLDADGDPENAISIAGGWGYVDRTASDDRSVRLINATKDLCLEVALNVYRKRYGAQVEGVAEVTDSGFVVEPKDLSERSRMILKGLRALV